MKKAVAAVLVCLLCVMNAQAEDSAREGLSIWEQIRNKIEKITPKQKPAVTTAVGGVRGSQADSRELYWKGEERPSAVSAEELDRFSAALSLAEAGADADALTAFQGFLKDFPDSPLSDDAKSAVAELARQQVAPVVPEDFSLPELPGFKLGL